MDDRVTMNRTFAFISGLVLAASFATPVSALASDNLASTVRVASEAVNALPTIDRFEDEGQTLELHSPSFPYVGDAAITLVYKDDEANVRHVTVFPGQLAQGAPALDGFLGTMDPAFLSFVRSSVADRMIRIKTRATALDRAEAALFFPSKRVQIVRPTETSNTFSETEFIPIAVD
jgi:hypothetical protein